MDNWTMALESNYTVWLFLEKCLYNTSYNDINNIIVLFIVSFLCGKKKLLSFYKM